MTLTHPLPLLDWLLLHALPTGMGATEVEAAAMKDASLPLRRLAVGALALTARIVHIIESTEFLRKYCTWKSRARQNE